MSRHNSRRLATSAVALGVIAAAVFAAGPADAATASPADSGPAPICFAGICVPQTWFVAGNVVTNDGLFQLLPTVSEANTTTASTQMTQAVTVSGQLTLSLSGSIAVNPASVLGAVTSLTPGGQVQVSGSDAMTGTVQVPGGEIGYLQFGIIYDQVQGTAYSRDIFGTVTSAVETATVPIGFGYIASVAPITNSSSTSDSTAVVTGK
jgi:hypothetical protein